MLSEGPEHLTLERIALESEIRDAFKGVTRNGGISWSEGWAIDLNGSEEECAAARASEKETRWEDLVEDAHWNTNSCPWSFLDAIGFRYYLAPAMIREIHGNYAWLERALDHPIDEAELRTLLTHSQSRAIGRFVRFMLNEAEGANHQSYAFEWRELQLKWA